MVNSGRISALANLNRQLYNTKIENFYDNLREDTTFFINDNFKQSDELKGMINDLNIVFVELNSEQQKHYIKNSFSLGLQ